MDKSINFNILEVNTLKTNKLIYSNSKNVIELNQYNCTNLILNQNDSNSLINTIDVDMDINITLSCRQVGVKYRLIISNRQKSLRINCKSDLDTFKGQYKLNNNNNIKNNNTVENNLKKKALCKTDSAEIIYIPVYQFGLYNGGYIDFTYIGDKYGNMPSSNINGTWLVDGNLIGEINIPRTINNYLSPIDKINLIIYSLEDNSNNLHLLYAISKIDTYQYFNKLNNNNLFLFLNSRYNIKIIDIESGIEMYDSNKTSNTYNIKIKSVSENAEDFVDLNNVLYNNNFVEGLINNSNFNNIQVLYNNGIVPIKEYNMLNTIEFKIEKMIKGVMTDILNTSYFNLIDLKAYYNNNSDELTLPNIFIDVYNGFTIKKNNINSSILN